jgi:hypothetical protein
MRTDQKSEVQLYGRQKSDDVVQRMHQPQKDPESRKNYVFLGGYFVVQKIIRTFAPRMKTTGKGKSAKRQ